jgi:alpha-2-macroglobulin
MRMKNLFASIFIVISVLFISCSDKSKIDSDPDLFKDYILSYSHGIISTQADIRVVLTFENNDWQPNQELNSDLFTIYPKVSGKVFAVNSNTVTFIPNEQLQQDTEYQVSFHLNELKEVSKELKTFVFKFRTIKQNFAVSFIDLQSYSKDYQYLNMNFQSADRLSSAAVSKLISAKQGDKKLKVKLKEKDLILNNFEFYIDSIQRFDFDTEVQIFWDGKELGIDQKGELSFPIPGKNNFTIVQAEMSNTEDAILVNFSDPIKPSQNFNGLVQLQDVPNLKFSTAGNILKIFYSDNVIGNKQLDVFQGIESQDNFKLKQNFSTLVTIGSDKPEIQFIRSGTILPTSNDLKINFKSINLNAVDVMVYKVYTNNILQFLQDNDYSSDYGLKRVGSPIAKQTIYLNPNRLKKMDRWNVFSIDLSKLIIPDPGAIYTVKLSYKKHTQL